jgi:SAM-dependent methyltransferase
VFDKFKNNLIKRFQTPLLEESHVDLNRWFESVQGRSLLALQKKYIESELQHLHGQRVLVQSPYSDLDLRESTLDSYSEYYATAPIALSRTKIGSEQSLMADPAFLPFSEGEIDLTIVHHVLEFSQNPQQVLKEVARVTDDQGYILILGFNPVSPTGALKLIKQSCGIKGLCQRQSIRIQRLQDWINFLDCSNLKIRYLSHALPLQSQRYANLCMGMNRSLGGSSLPFASTFSLLARKDRGAFKPQRLQWRMDMLGGALAMPKARTTIAVSNALDTKVVPFRKS